VSTRLRRYANDIRMAEISTSSLARREYDRERCDAAHFFFSDLSAMSLYFSGLPKRLCLVRVNVNV